MKCPYCGTANPAGEDFCSACGGYLKSDISTAATPAPETHAPAVQSIPEPVAEPQSTHSSAPDTSNTGSMSGISRTLAPNIQLQNGRYVVERVLGQGGMGAAVLARDTRVSNKKVVIKELVSENVDPAQKQEDVRNFEREVDTLAHLDHPLIPTVTDSFQEGSRYYMVQEYAAGENLEAYMERLNKPVPEREALTYTSQILDILAYLAQQHPPLVHRDIKPANIIVGAKDKRARLVDFGIARAEAAKQSKRKQTSALGTPGYAPPEQYQGHADARSDLYALAATLHHLLTHRDPADYPPFNYPAVRTLNPGVTSETERVLERALMMNNVQRYQNAEAMKHDIDEILLRHFQSAPDSTGYTFSPGLAALDSSPTKPATNHPRPAPPDPTPLSRRSDQGWDPYYSPSPSSSPYTQQQSQGYAPRQRQAGMYAPAPAQRQSQPDRSNSYMMPSFILLLVVILIIAAILFLLPYFAGIMPMSISHGCPGCP